VDDGWAGGDPEERPVLDTPKRVVVGRPLRSDRLHDTLLPKRLALPVSPPRRNSSCTS
jgi:hypothetical protein